ncbi:MAG: efflux RND transporter periplasmic adaptor subunit [Steroidobacteraceae bacterium]
MRYTAFTILAVAALSLAACGKTTPSAPPEAGEAGHEAEHEGGHVALTPGQIRTAAIVVAQAGPAVIRETLPVYGVIAPDAERVREVGARFPGVIRSVRSKVGDSVRAGETLATVESNESLQTYAVVAPLSGVVTARQANSGEQTGDKALFTVADLSKVWVELALFPRDSAKVRVGQAVRVASADAGLTAQGHIVYVAPFGSSSNQTLTARVRLDNAQRRWAPGLYVSADVTLGEAPARLAVRNEALQGLEGRTVVFVQDHDGFEPRPVRTGRTDGEWSEVLEGLEPGERYATENSFILKAELGKGEASHEH